MKSKKRGRSSTSSRKRGRRKRKRPSCIFIHLVHGDLTKRTNFWRAMDAPGGDSKRLMKSKVALVFLLLAVAGLSASAASPFKKTEGNRLLHVPSGIVFPGKIALFDRIDTKIFSSNGRDIRARYQLDAFILGDVYVYPVGAPGYGKDLNGEFQVQQRAIREINKNVKLAAETTIQTTQNGRTITGRK